MTETLTDRIRARLAATGKNAHAASIEAGGSPSLIPNILNGRSANPRMDTLRKIAPALGTTAEYLMDGDLTPPVVDQPAAVPEDFRRLDMSVPNTALWPKDVPVWGSAMGSLIQDNFEGTHVFSGEPIDYARRPPSLQGVRDAYAVYVTGDSMDPMHQHGQIRLVHPHRPPSPGDTVIVYTRHWDSDPGQGYIKILRRRAGEHLILEQLNPRATLTVPLKYVVSVHKVMDMNDLFGV